MNFRGRNSLTLRQSWCFGEVPCRHRPRYTLSMTNDANLPKRIILWSLGLAAFAGLTGVAFSAWLGQGSAILLSMAESGLAWCF